MLHSSKMNIFPFNCLLLLWILTIQHVASQKIHELVDDEIVTFQWLQIDSYDTDRQQSRIDERYIRYPHPEQRYKTTSNNDELLILSQKKNQLVPSVKELLERKKAPRKLFKHEDIKFLFATGVNARHRYAEGIQLRRHSYGNTDEVIVPFLYYLTGWPFMILLLFGISVFVVPILGCTLVHAGFKVGRFYKYFLWGPIKHFLRSLLIKRELNNQSWIRYLAPDYFLRPRSTFKVPYVLRNDVFEDIPHEVTSIYTPPINPIDYTMYVLSREDYDELDLEMDELEYIDEMLQFRETNPKDVARLLKFRLGVEKFYYYFDEDILSDEEEEKKVVEPPKPEVAPNSFDAIKLEEGAEQEAKYLEVLRFDEPWMHPEFDKTFKGTQAELKEIQHRRSFINDLKEDIKTLHELIQRESKYDANYEELSVDKKKTLQVEAKKLMDRYLRYSTRTKERIAELEPSENIRNVHNVALSKYLPLIDTMSHYNHRLNLRHEKQKDPTKRKVQLDIFGGP
ncbi:hypothetical protein Ocin01_07752 [Orchesella cincta]|uniref:Uncharacterized protein n=1 Tax=Orchesella cincta TaxID=48709 RepID=A0A1D2N0X6_ORCCI|nr:hypothetical protein Ocin01_07752 [Orchesella cincta]